MKTVNVYSLTKFLSLNLKLGLLKKLFLICILLLSRSPLEAQLENFYSFNEPYFMSPAFARLKIKSCTVYEEKVSDSIHAPILKEHYRFDSLGRLASQRRYYLSDTTEGIQIYHRYNNQHQIIKTEWTFIEDAEDWYTNYTYDKNGKLTNLHGFNKRDGRQNFKQCEVAKFRYTKEGLLLKAKLKNDFYKQNFEFEYKNDTLIIKDLLFEYKWKNVGVRLVENKNAAGTHTYEYNEEGQLLKYTLRSVWDNPLIHEEFSYINGLLISSIRTEFKYDETIVRRRDYKYE